MNSSRYVTNLNNRLERARGQPNENELMLEWVACLARLGMVREARQRIDDLRDRVLSANELRLSVLYHIADGLCHYYTNMGATARDRFSRAKALSSAALQQNLSARAASWQALLQYGAHEFDEMVHSLDECFLNAERIDSETLSRACLLVAQTIHIANRFGDAMPWYRRARQYCAETEDDLTLSAMMHNMASIWTSNARNSQLGGPPTQDSSRQALSGALASLNFDQLVGISALDIFAPLLLAQIESITNNHAAAVSIYRDQLDGLNIESMKGWRVWLLSDFAWNLLKIGDIESAQLKIVAVENLLDSSLHPDDHAAALSRVAAIYEELGDSERANKFRLESEKLWRKFSNLQCSMLETVESSKAIEKFRFDRP